MFVLPCVFVEFIDVRPEIVGELLFERQGDGGGHRFRARPGQRRLTEMVGKSIAGRSLTGSRRYDMTPNTTMPEHDERRGDRALDEQRCEIHESAFCAVAVLTVTRLPGTSRSWPSMTTVSPALTPSLSTVSLPAVRATVTGRISTV